MSRKNIDYSSGGLRVAVVGGGISGIMAAHLISRRNDVVLFEKEPKLGGHTYTVDVSNGDGPSLAVDMGFIVFNEPNYPVFNRFLSELNVERAESDMSFAFHDPETDFMYAGTGPRGMLARWQNLFSPTFWRMMTGIRRFGRTARRDLETGALAGLTIGQYLRAQDYGPEFENNYLLPMAGAIWSAAEGESRDFPAEALVRFFDNHVLLNYAGRPSWHYVKGGSNTYVRVFEKTFRGEVRTSMPIHEITRNENGVTLKSSNGEERFDAVVLATHADVSLSLLSDPGDAEIRFLAPWEYAANRVTLHTDPSFLPPTEAARASWNFIKDPSRPPHAPVGVSYHMNRLQRIESAREYVVTLNASAEPAEGALIEDTSLEHPQFTLNSLATQKSLPELDGVNRTFFCGAYQGYGFHEDGARSGLRVARHFGVDL